MTTFLKQDTIEKLNALIATEAENAALMKAELEAENCDNIAKPATIQAAKINYAKAALLWNEQTSFECSGYTDLSNSQKIDSWAIGINRVVLCCKLAGVEWI